MKCEECRELLFDYYDNEIEVSIKNQMDEHFKTCFACRKEFEKISSALNFFQINMPVITVEDNFTQKVMRNISLARTISSFGKIMAGLGIILIIFALAMIISLAPIMLSLISLLGSVLVGIISTVNAIFSMFPIIQISGGIILIILLLAVTVSIRRIVLRDSFI